MAAKKKVIEKQKSKPRANAQPRYIAVFLIALMIFGATAYIAQKGVPTGWEVTWFREVNGWSESWYHFMVAITFFGSTLWAPIAVGITLALRMYRLAWRLALTILGAYAAVHFAKHFIDRERPLGLLSDVHARVSETGMGFPSGHATLITVVVLTLLPYISTRWRWTLVIPVILVGLSRLYLGVHVPLDVIGGVALGTAAAMFLRILPERLRVLLRVS